MNESMRYGKQKKLTNRWKRTLIETTRNGKKHARDTLINDWQHSAREDHTGHPCDATKKRNKKKEKASNLEMTSVIRKRSQM